MIHKMNGYRINYIPFYGLGILILLFSLRNMDIFHQTHKNKEIFFNSEEILRIRDIQTHPFTYTYTRSIGKNRIIFKNQI